MTNGKHLGHHRHLGLAMAAMLAVLAAAPGQALARRGSSGGEASGGGPFALGLILGEPTGLSGKLFLGGGRHAIDFGVGFSSGYYDDNGWRVHVDYLWHPATLTKNPTFVLPFYVGIGGIIGSWRHRHFEDRNLFGPRVPVGLDMYFRGAPIDVFFELALAVNLAGRDYDCGGGDVCREHQAWLEGAIGVRYSF